jgi:hypothetical protein
MNEELNGEELDREHWTTRCPRCNFEICGQDIVEISSKS